MLTSSKSDQPQRTAIIVLGMHRSGTSAITRVLNLLGADLPGNLMPCYEDNKTGFWESLEFQEYNDTLLNLAGSAWYDWRQIDSAWRFSDVAKKGTRNLEKIIRRNFKESRLFVIKDPRICRLLPLWQEAIINSGTSVKYVIPFRNPIEVVSSLQRRDNFTKSGRYTLTKEGCYALWLRHVLDAELGSRGLPRVFFLFDCFLNDWEKTINKITFEIKVDWPIDPQSAAIAVDDFINANNKHTAFETEEVQSDSSIYNWIIKTYFAMLELNENSMSKPAQESLDQVRNEFDNASDAFGAVWWADHDARLVGDAKILELNRYTLELNKNIRGLNNHIHRLEDSLKNLKAVHGELEADQRKHKISSQRRLGKAAVQLTRWSSSLCVRERIRVHKNARELEESGLFDPEWYLENNSGVFIQRLSPAAHYLISGWLQQCNPNPYFDTSWYLENYPDIDKLGMNPLWHYLKYGATEFRDPGPNFSTREYVQEITEEKLGGQNPLSHFLNHKHLSVNRKT